MRLPLDQLHRLAGPPDHPVLVAVDEDDWRDDVDDMEEKVEDGWEPPPMVVTYRDDQLAARGRQPPGRGPPPRRRATRPGPSSASTSPDERDRFLARAGQAASE